MPERREFQVLIWDGEYWSRGRESYTPCFPETYLNRMALDGWDMVGITATTLVLRREVPNA